MARILVIDDNPDERMIYSAVLHYHGHEVHEAGDAKTGIDLAQSSRPDLILMDVHLPVMNGLLATEILRASPASAAVPIICMTGFDVNPAHALASGCSQFVRKPISPSELTRVVDALLRGR